MLIRIGYAIPKKAGGGQRGEADKPQGDGADLALTFITRVSSPLLMQFVKAGAVLLFALQVVVAMAQQRQAASPDLGWLARDPNFVDVSDVANVHVDLRYASQNNFLAKNLYGNFHRCFLQKVAADKFRRVALALAEARPGWKLLVFDCLRPRSLQETLFAAVKGTPREEYVANPKTGSIHNYGLAVDLSLEDEHGHEVDMGTRFDDFTALARPAEESNMRALGRLRADQLEHRLLLRKVMTQAGFIQLPIEWWHYDALPKAEVRKNFKIVE